VSSLKGRAIATSSACSRSAAVYTDAAKHIWKRGVRTLEVNKCVARSEYCDLVKRASSTPTKVTRTALQNAASIASLC